MTPLLIPRLLRSLAQTVQYASVTCAPAAGAHRCMSSIAAALVHTGGRFQTWGNPLYAPLLAQKQQLVALQPSMGMKTKTALKKRCKDCFFVRRRGRLYVFCKSHPRHKQRQG